MKIETQLLEDHQAKLTVEVESELLEEAKRRAAGKIARKVKIPGFRPGKAPFAVIQRTVGDEAIFEEALEMLVDEVYPKALKESELEPYGPGRLEKIASVDPLTLEFIVPLEAEVTLGDYRSLRKPYEPEAVTDQEVEKALQGLRERQAVIEPVDRPAQEGDVVTIRLSIHAKDNPEKVILKETTNPIVIRSDDEDELFFPGFSKNLIGLSAGDSGVITHLFPYDSVKPENDQEEAREASIEAEFHYRIEAVKSRTLPELGDEFAQSLGDVENLEDLRTKLRAHLEAEVLNDYNETYDEEILQQAIEQAEFKYPPQMLEDEIENMIQELEQRLGRENLDLDIYLKAREKTLEDLKAEIKPVAEKRLKRGLFLYELGKAEAIEVDQEELKEEVDQQMLFLSLTIGERDVKKLSNRNVQKRMIQNTLFDMLITKTIERLRDIFSGKLETAEQELQREYLQSNHSEVNEEASNPREQTQAAELPAEKNPSDD